MNVPGEHSGNNATGCGISLIDTAMMTAAIQPVSATVPHGSADALRILAAAQDPAAWAWIVEQEGPGMFRFAQRILGNAAAADDVCQEAFLHIRAGAHLFRAPAEGDADMAAHAWILRVTASAAAMWSRGERRRRARERIAVADAAQAAADGPDQSRDVELLQQALDALPESQRLPVVLHHLGGQDYETIAQTLGISAGTARVRVHRARDTLRDHLSRLGVVTAVAAICARANAAECVVPAGNVARWNALLTSPLTPAASKAAIFGGISLMTKLALLCSVLAVAGLITVTARPLAAVDATGSRITITGTAHALGNAGGGFDPHTAYATVTTADGTVYDVMGGAGMIIDLRADGKQVTVNGVPGDTGGQKTISGRSIDVAIDGVPIESTPNSPQSTAPTTTTTTPPTTASGNAPPGTTTTTSSTRKVTLSGIAHALVTAPAGATLNPSQANASLTVTTPNTNPPATTTYLVYGYAGVILAMQADGKQVEVTGSVGTRDGKPFIYGRSVDVSINGVPIEGGH